MDPNKNIFLENNNSIINSAIESLNIELSKLIINNENSPNNEFNKLTKNNNLFFQRFVNNEPLSEIPRIDENRKFVQVNIPEIPKFIKSPGMTYKHHKSYPRSQLKNEKNIKSSQHKRAYAAETKKRSN